SKFAVEISEADLAGGPFTGSIALVSGSEGLSALGYFELAGARAAEVIPSDGSPPISGGLWLKATIEGAGLTPAAFIGSLQGSGEASCDNCEFAGLNVKVFDALTRAVDLGVPADTRQIRDFAAVLLNNEPLPVKHAQSKFSIVGGQIRLIDTSVEVQG